MSQTGQPQILFPYEAPPAAGETYEMAPGVWWVRLPLPLALDHVNIWVLDDGDGWTIVDCGLETEDSIAIWAALASGPFAGKRFRRLIATHGHPDHIGAARHLAQTFDLSLAATMVEWQTAVMRHGEMSGDALPGQTRFLIEHGYPAEKAARRSAFGKSITAMMSAPPELDSSFSHGDVVRFGQRNWRIIIAGGHAEAHASFYCEEDHILIAGDQILPRITPFVGVDWRTPEDDPLKTYLDSMAIFGELPVDTLVLPGHGLPFRGLPVRLGQMHKHHDVRLDSVIAGLDRPRHAFDIAGLLFPRAVGTGHERMALSESIAHLHYLLSHGRVGRTRDGEGVLLFERG